MLGGVWITARFLFHYYSLGGDPAITQITICCRPNVRPTMIFMLDLRQASSVGPTQICS